MWPVITLSNGEVIEIQHRVRVRALCDMVSDPTFYRRPKTVKARSFVELRHWPPGTLTLVKPASGNTRFHDIKTDPVEGVDFELIPKK